MINDIPIHRLNYQWYTSMTANLKTDKTCIEGFSVVFPDENGGSSLGQRLLNRNYDQRNSVLALFLVVYLLFIYGLHV